MDIWKNNKSKIIIGAITIVSLFSIQTLTFLTIGQKRLKEKLLPDYFSSLSYNSDSVFVQDFYVSECFTGDDDTYLSHNLQNQEQEIKQKFNVKYAYFDTLDNFNWDNSTKKNYNLIYITWTKRPNWLTLFGLYSSTQTERLIVDKKFDYERVVSYHWLLFFWIPTFEWFKSSDYRNL